MEVKLIKKSGDSYTQFKISHKEMETAIGEIIRLMCLKPVKASSRFIYYEIKGDFLNKPKEGNHNE